MVPRKKPQSGAAARKRRTSAKRSASRSRTPSKSSRTSPKRRAPSKPRKTTPKREQAKKRTPTKARDPKTRDKGRSKPPKAAIITLLAVALLVIAVWSFYPVARIQYREGRQKARLERELASLKERNEGLRAQVDHLKTPAGVEQVARESLGMVKDGEHVYVVTNLQEEPSATVSAEECAAIADAPPTPTQRVLDAVFGIEE